jgi:hypothetical protein
MMGESSSMIKIMSSPGRVRPAADTIPVKNAEPTGSGTPAAAGSFETEIQPKRPAQNANSLARRSRVRRGLLGQASI